MKKRIVALLLCCVMLLTLSPSLIATATADDETTPAQTEVTVSPAKANLPRNKKVTLTAQAKDAKSYQWQIMAEDDLWVDISGETESTIQVSYAMVASLLNGSKAQLRCKTDLGTTDPATVTVTEAQAVAAAPAKAAPKAGTVMKEAEAINKAVVQASEGDVADTGTAGTDGNETPDVKNTYSIIINYVFADGTQAANSWTATIEEGSSYSGEVISPDVLGYTPDKATQKIEVSNIAKNEIYTVTYLPAEVAYTVIHKQQNVNDDDYTEFERQTKKGYTESPVAADLAKEYDGFTALLYNTNATIAADGSTVVEIKYDRNYYLMKFDLDGGYGVEPIYARYGAPISVDETALKKPGYTFEKWDKDIPATMPAENTSYTASWKIGESGFTVVFWYQNANDDGYSVAGTYKPADVAPGTTKSSGDYKDQNFTGRDTKHFTYNTAKAETVTVKGDGSTVLNVYYTRNVYSMKLWDSQNYREVDVLTISAKFQQDISSYFPVEFDKYEAFTSGYYNNTKYPGNGYVCNWLVDEDWSHVISRVAFDIMPGENTSYQVYNFIKNSHNCFYYLETLNGTSGTGYSGKTFNLYKKIPIISSGNLTYDEEFFDIVGFTKWKSDPKFDSPSSEPYVQKENKFYYTRNSYNLKFFNYNADVSDKGGSVQYEAPLKSYYFKPVYPAKLEANAYKFAGWYTTAGCYDGSEVNWDTMTMPASDVTLYAKWVPVTHTVKTWLTNEMKTPVNVGNTSSNEQTVSHGSLATAPDAPKNGQYTFVGWFYMDNGVEKAFDFENMPVRKDLNLYAKWSPNVMVDYTIKYAVKDEKGNLTYIASDTMGQALADSTQTFEAKAGTQLFPAYRTGYFPVTNSHSMKMSIDGSNEYTFIYVAMDKVPYTVRYLVKGADPKTTDEADILHEDKTDETPNAIITEKFEVVKGYRPDAYQKRLVLSANANENVIIFWYVKDDEHAPVQVIHWTQNIAGDSYTEYQSSTDLNAKLNKEQTSEALTIPGFTYVKGTAVAGTKRTDFTTPDTPNATLTADGLVLNLYYDRIEYPYEFRFVEKDSNPEKQLADSVTGSARYQAQVTQPAKDIPGYTLVSAENQAINIAIEDSADVASKNVRTFYYTEQTVDIKYEVVGPVGCGTVTPASETVKVITGTPTGSVAAKANDNFRFVGWFKDKDCTQPVDGNWVANNKLTPGQSKNYGTEAAPVMGYEAAIYYAKFEYDITDLTITKTYADGAPKDPNQSAVFVVTGGDLGDGLTVVLNKGNNFKVVIKGLTVGTTYTVTEKTGWTWRYTTDPTSQNSQSIQLVANEGNNTITFTNTLKENKWLTGGAWCDNSWAKGESSKSTSTDYSGN